MAHPVVPTVFEGIHINKKNKNMSFMENKIKTEKKFQEFKIIH